MGKIRMGMIGGGEGAFIGAVHRMAAYLDGQFELVCGAFNSDPLRSKKSGKDLHLPDQRVYSDWQTMLEVEAQLPEDTRMQCVSIVTPNHLHFAPAKASIVKGFSVICDKPLCLTMEEAEELQSLVHKYDCVFALTHNYTGYPMVKQAKAMISNGDLGKIKKVVIAYPQGWLSSRIESTGQKQASWRTDPKKSGIAGSIGDIGTHAENISEYITGLKIDSLCADISTLVDGRLLDDDGNMLLRFNNGAKGLMYVSQISAGEENNLQISIYGEKGGLSWKQMSPNSLKVQWLDKPTQIFRSGGPGLYPIASKACRLPAGHPEGYIEAFANIYSEVANAIRKKKQSGKVVLSDYDFPTINDGVRGMRFIYKAIESGNSHDKWVKF